MTTRHKWRMALVLGVTALGAFFLLPTLVGPENMPKWLPHDALNLGLDLQGGLHLELKVDTDKAVENTVARLAEDIDRALREARIRALPVEAGPRRLKVTVGGEDGAAKLEELLDKRYGGLEVIERIPVGERIQYTLGLTADETAAVERYAIDQGIETIRNRIDQFGVAEPSITSRGDGEIVIQLPGLGSLSADKVARELSSLAAQSGATLQNVEAKGTEVVFTSPDELSADKIAAAAEKQFTGLTKAAKTKNADGSVEMVMAIATSARAKKLIGQTAQLEFRLLDETMPVSQALTSGAPFDAEVLNGKKKVDPRTGRETGQRDTFLVKKRVLMTGEVVKDARFMVDRSATGYEVLLQFDGRGAEMFGDITTQNEKKPLAIVLDGVVQSAPVIREPILGGSASITGNFTREEARDLSIALRSGSLPAPVIVQQEIEVGPSLGQDSIDAGVFSFIVGSLLVLAFMVLYYKGAGMLANLAVAVNIVVLLGALAALRATLTLPGIAGIILTVGMAVDANVLIYERIREELRLGKTPRSAVDLGFEKAFGTIFDANLTTILAAFVLYTLGTGPIRGFAVTLGIGILTSMFTAIVGTRAGFELFLSRKNVRRLSI